MVNEFTVTEETNTPQLSDQDRLFEEFLKQENIDINTLSKPQEQQMVEPTIKTETIIEQPKPVQTPPILGTPQQTKVNHKEILAQPWKTDNPKLERLERLNAIVKDSGSIGEFKIGGLKITINSLKEYQNDLVILK